MNRRLISSALLMGFLLACANDPPASGGAAGSAGAGASTQAGGGAAGKPSTIPSDPATEVQVARSDEASAELAGLAQKIAGTKGLTGAALIAAHPAPSGALPYDPQQAAGFDLIQASGLALTASELPSFAKNGFAISTAKRYPTFTYGYRTIYAADLPVYISADSILHAVHRGFDDNLATIEAQSLSPDLLALLGSMRGALSAQSSGLPSDVAADLDLFLGVGAALLSGEPPTAKAGGDVTAMKKLYDAATKGSGAADIKLFGVGRLYDFSQFTPRGHYTKSAALERYFRAMMWFGRTDLRFLEPDPSGRILFRKRQVLAAVAMRGLLDAPALATFDRVDGTIGAFVGEHDSMTLHQVDDLLAKLGAKDLAAVDALPDDTIANAITRGGFGAQRIASQYMINGTASTLPLASIFQLFGQRYTVDSHVFSNVVFDRAAGGTVMRMMPDPLDVAYAAIGNDSAASLLAPQLEKFSYAPDLESMRLLVDAHGDGYWNASLGTQWMSALRAMSPTTGENAQKLPAAMKTEAWGRRVLNTQLASWAELRHDTILHTKQSYTGGAGCVFPDAYVDPYPEVFARLAAMAERSSAIVEGMGEAVQREQLIAYYGRVHATLVRLEGMARKQQTGEAFSEEDLAFVNKAVTTQPLGCADEIASGWYADLFANGTEALAVEPTIADVHTQPTDEVGNEVGRVLHVGTGFPRLMVVTVDTCQGPRAYAGLASMYAETITEDWQRLTDDPWLTEVNKGVPDVPWMAPVLSK